MRLLIASDIHGSAYWCRRLLEAAAAERPNRLILLGDLLYHGPRNDLPEEYNPKAVIPMLNRWREHVTAVRGNCEAEVDQMVLEFPCMADYALLMVDGKQFFLTHGHLWNPERLPPLPEGSCFLSGHTHVGGERSVGGIRCLNPGSVSIPKDGRHSYLLYEDGVFSLKTLED